VSFLPINPLKCFAAYTEERLDGLIAISSSERVKIELIATAPWNFYKWGTIRRIGKGLVCFAVNASIDIGKEGVIFLDAVPEAEKFYRSLGMKETGKINEKNLKEFVMSPKAARCLVSGFKPHLTN
jgi:hypothetical protein